MEYLLSERQQEEKATTLLPPLTCATVSSHPLSARLHDRQGASAAQKIPLYIELARKTSLKVGDEVVIDDETSRLLHDAEARHLEYETWLLVIAAMPTPPTLAESRRLQAEGLAVAKVHNQLAAQAALDNLPSIRRSCLQRALASMPAPPLGSKALAETLYRFGCFLLQQGSAPQKATGYLRRAIKVAEPEPGIMHISVSARLNLCVSLNRAGERTAALQEAQQALDILQRLPPQAMDASDHAAFEGIARYNLMCCLEASGHHKSALAHAKAAKKAAGRSSLPEDHVFATQLKSAEEDYKESHKPGDGGCRMHAAKTVTSIENEWSRHRPDPSATGASKPPLFKQATRFSTKGAGEDKDKELARLGQALHVMPTKEMRQELERLGVALPDDAELTELAERFVNWIEDWKYKTHKDPSHTWANLFNVFDEDKSGFVTFDEMQKCVRSTLDIKAKAFPANRLKALWCALDDDDSNQVMVDEMTRFFRRADAVFQERTKALRRQMTGFTTKGAGETKDKELALLRRALDAQPTKEMRMELTKLGMDLPDDNGLTALAKQFFNWIEDWKYKKSMDPSHTWANLFSVFDGDGSGFITFDEMEKCLRTSLEIKTGTFSTNELKALWCALDEDDSNSIMMDEISKFFKRADDVFQARTKQLRRQATSFTTKGAGEHKDKELAQLGRRAFHDDRSLKAHGEPAQKRGSGRLLPDLAGAGRLSPSKRQSSRILPVEPSLANLPVSKQHTPAPPKDQKPPKVSPRVSRASSSMLPEVSKARGRATTVGVTPQAAAITVAPDDAAERQGADEATDAAGGEAADTKAATMEHAVAQKRAVKPEATPIAEEEEATTAEAQPTAEESEKAVEPEVVAAAPLTATESDIIAKGTIDAAVETPAGESGGQPGSPIRWS